MSEKKYRLVTRSDMDGLVCGTLLKYLDIIDEITFVHPKDMQDGLIEITNNDITTNLPYVDGVYLAFDHHFSETLRNEKRDNHIINPDAPSAAQVVYDYYDGDEVFPGYFTSMMRGLIKIYKYDKFDNEIFLYHIYSNSLISELSNLNTNEIFCFSNASFIEDSVVLSIDFLKLQEHFLNNNLLVKELMNSLLKKTNQLQSLVNRELVFDATAKVAYMLVSDLKMFNKLKRQDVSFMLHIQPETLSRVLKKLSRDNIIEIENQQVIIKDEIALNSIFKGVAI
jgi:CRP/FNR family transcriptional regulator